ncbi:TFIIH/NER complex subunit [Puccinia graminis f. sp. tritici]|uniref:TFIIH/NER complex subunit n=1 Tax=Puccinia graminis f. sp. tritici TaxID=56615 RepID=A0A5B0SM13_PUCGR|nr:TFIIH/NER complex subunit [Puccinia graminis f. sp. tritici]
MPSLGGLIDPSSMDNEETNRPDIKGELGQWDNYSSMFDLKRLDANLQPGYMSAPVSYVTRS